MNPEVIIIIVNWNGYGHTSELLDSLKNICYRNFAVTIVDNNSSGNDVQKLKSDYGNWIKVIESKENLGFAGGNNLGMHEALQRGFDFVLLINNDTTVEPDFLDILVNKMKRESNIGIAAPLINYYYDKQRIWSAGGKISFLRSSGFAVRDINEDKIDNSDRIVDFASGCCILIRREVLEKIGFFDEEFFLYLEDTDYCFRTIKAGYKICITPVSKIYHKVKSSTGYQNFTVTLYYETRNRLYFAKKNYHFIYFIPVLYIFFTMLLKSILWLISGNFKRVKAVGRAFNDFFHKSMGKREF